MSLVLVATIVPEPEHRAEVIAIFEGIIPRVHAEEGCELYALHTGRDRLVIIEKWADEASLEAHRDGAALREAGPLLADKLAVPTDVQILMPHPAGTTEQGAV